MYRSPTDEIMLDMAAAADDTEREVAAAAAAAAAAEDADEAGGEVEPLGEDASDAGEGPFAGGGCSSIVIEVADAQSLSSSLTAGLDGSNSSKQRAAADGPVSSLFFPHFTPLSFLLIDGLLVRRTSFPRRLPEVTELKGAEASRARRSTQRGYGRALALPSPRRRRCFAPRVRLATNRGGPCRDTVAR